MTADLVVGDQVAGQGGVGAQGVDGAAQAPGGGVGAGDGHQVVADGVAGQLGVGVLQVDTAAGGRAAADASLVADDQVLAQDGVGVEQEQAAAGAQGGVIPDGGMGDGGAGVLDVDPAAAVQGAGAAGVAFLDDGV